MNDPLDRLIADIEAELDAEDVGSPMGAFEQCLVTEELGAGVQPLMGAPKGTTDVKLNLASAFVGLGRSAIEQARAHRHAGGRFDRDPDGDRMWEELLRDLDRELRTARRSVWDQARTIDMRGGRSHRSQQSLERCRDLSEEILVGVRAMLATESEPRAFAVELLRRDHVGLSTCAGLSAVAAA